MVDQFARRDLRRYADSKKQADMGQELGLLLLCIASGLTGVYTESIVMTCTLFLGGVGTWIAMGIPKWIDEQKQKIITAEEEKRARAAGKALPAKAAAGGEEAEAAGVQLPSGEQTLALIKKRRSIYPKDFTGAKVPKAQLELLLEAANWAPTHKLTQPWRFVVLEGDSKSKFESLTLELVGKYTVPSDKAAEAVERLKGKAGKQVLISHYLAICMSREPNKAGHLPPEWEDMAAVACAVQNMQLLGTALGVACYWSSWQAVARDAPEMSEFLGLDAARGDKCLGVLCVGISERAGNYRGSRTPAMDKVTWRS